MADSDKKEEEVPKAEAEKKEEEPNSSMNKPDTDDNKDDEKKPSIPERPPKKDPGDGKPKTPPQFIPFKWNKAFRKKAECDTLHMLYLTSKALELVRRRTIERNRYFKSIGRSDRFINQLDAPQIITNLLDWHNEDREKNKFDGNLVMTSEKLFMINDMISDIGGCKKGPATRIYTKLKKDVTIQYTQWTELPLPTLKLENWGYSTLYKGEIILKDCTVDQMVTLLTFVNPDPTPDDKEAADYENFPQGILEMMARKAAKKAKLPALQQIPDWREKIAEYFRKEKIDGKKMLATQARDICFGIMNYLMDPSILKEDGSGQPKNIILRGQCNIIYREYKKVYVDKILKMSKAQNQK